MAERGYQFEHQINGKRTQLLDVRDIKGGNDRLAELTAIQHARNLKANSVSAGDVVVTGYWGANGFTYSVPVAKADKTKHELEKLSDKPYPGFEAVCDVIDALWPYEEPRPVSETSLTFYVWNGQVQVTISRPRGAAVDMVYADQKILLHHTGPTEFVLVAHWEITSRQAKKIWNEVCMSVANLGKQYLKK